MTTKIDLFRVIYGKDAAIVERLIVLWGTPDIHDYIGGLMAAAGSDAGALGGDVREALTRVTELHDQEFPLHSKAMRDPVPPALAANPDFQLIEARFPRIGRQLAPLWGHAEFGKFISDLMNDTRLGRQGFPPDAASALMALIRAHETEFPQFVSKDSDIWILNNKIW